MGRKEFIPFARKVNSWVISNDMLKNETFNLEVNKAINEEYALIIEKKRNQIKCDLSLVWQGVKDTMVCWAKAIEKDIRYEQNRKLNTLEVQYLMALNMPDVKESKEYMQQIKKGLNDIYKERSNMKVKK